MTDQTPDAIEEVARAIHQRARERGLLTDLRPWDPEPNGPYGLLSPSLTRKETERWRSVALTVIEEVRLMPLADISALDEIAKALQTEGTNVTPVQAIHYLLDELDRLRSMIRDRDVLIARYRAGRGENRSPVAGS